MRTPRRFAPANTSSARHALLLSFGSSANGVMMKNESSIPAEAPMKLYTYLNFGGNCREAFEFYLEHLGAKITEITTYGELPEGGEEVPPEWKNAVVHARIAIGDTLLLGADVQPDRFQPMRSAYLTLIVNSDEEAERLYGLFAEGGEIFMPMEETFFAHRFAMLRDRFGTSWMLLHERASPQA